MTNVAQTATPLASLRAAVEAMTPGPWSLPAKRGRDHRAGWTTPSMFYFCDCEECGGQARTRDANAAGIVALVNVARELIAVAEAADSVLRRQVASGTVNEPLLLALSALRSALERDAKEKR